MSTEIEKGHHNIRTIAERVKLVGKVNRLVRKGLTVKEACAQIGYHWGLYYTWRRQVGSSRSVKPRRGSRNGHVNSEPLTAPRFGKLADLLNQAALVEGHNVMVKDHAERLFKIEKEWEAFKKYLGVGKEIEG